MAYDSASSPGLSSFATFFIMSFIIGVYGSSGCGAAHTSLLLMLGCRGCLRWQRWTSIGSGTPVSRFFCRHSSLTFFIRFHFSMSRLVLVAFRVSPGWIEIGIYFLLTCPMVMGCRTHSPPLWTYDTSSTAHCLGFLAGPGYLWHHQFLEIHSWFKFIFSVLEFSKGCCWRSREPPSSAHCKIF